MMTVLTTSFIITLMFLIFVLNVGRLLHHYLFVIFNFYIHICIFHIYTYIYIYIYIYIFSFSNRCAASIFGLPRYVRVGPHCCRFFVVRRRCRFFAIPNLCRFLLEGVGWHLPLIWLQSEPICPFTQNFSCQRTELVRPIVLLCDPKWSGPPKS